MQFADRYQAGNALATKLKNLPFKESLVCGLPRGGVIIAQAVAKALGSPTNIICARKVAHPLNPEYAIGAVSEGGIFVGQKELLQTLDREWLSERVEEEILTARDYRRMYMDGQSLPDLTGQPVIVVDDGVATGYTLLAALLEIKQKNPSVLIAAVPVLPTDVLPLLLHVADQIVAVDMPENYLGSVGSYYQTFTPVSDQEVIKALAR